MRSHLIIVALLASCVTGCASSGHSPQLSVRDQEDVRSAAAMATATATLALHGAEREQFRASAYAIASGVKGITEGDATVGAVTLESVRGYVLSHAPKDQRGQDVAFLIDQLAGIVQRRLADLPTAGPTTQPVTDALTRSLIGAVADGVMDATRPMARSNP